MGVQEAKTYQIAAQDIAAALSRGHAEIFWRIFVDRNLHPRFVPGQPLTYSCPPEISEAIHAELRNNGFFVKAVDGSQPSVQPSKRA